MFTVRGITLAIASQCVELFEQGDIFFLLIGGLLLMLVCQHAGKSHEAVLQWGTRAGVLSFAAWYVRDVSVNGLYGAGQLVSTGIRALLVLLYVTNLAWLVFSIVVTAYSSAGRFGMRRFFRSRLASQLTNVREDVAATTDEFSEVEPTVSAEEETQLMEVAALHAEQQSERYQIRFELELLYDRYRHELSDLLPPETFAEYFNIRLTDDLPVDMYRMRAEQVSSMLRERLQLPNDEAAVWESMEEIITDFNTRLQRLQYHDLDEDTLEVLQIQLNEERNAALQEYARKERTRRPRS